MYVEYSCYKQSFCYGLVFLHKSHQILVDKNNPFEGLNISWHRLNFDTQIIAGCYHTRLTIQDVMLHTGILNGGKY